jgi:hypothetical protein
MNMPTRSVTFLSVTLLLAVALALSAWAQLTSVRADLAKTQTALLAMEVAMEAARAREKVAAQKAKWKQKASAKAKRIAAAVPVFGAAVIVWFEEREYREWRDEHRDIEGELEARRAYYKEVYTLVQASLEEEFGEWKRTRPEAWAKLTKAIDDWYRRLTASMSS